MAKILVFDNYDSFTYNLVHLVEKIIHQKVDVYRNDEIALEKVKEYDKIILSPGPGIPEEAGQLLPLIKEYASSKSILGVCLGHQAIGEVFGGKIVRAPSLMHGKTSAILHDSKTVFRGLPQGFPATRYHSLAVTDIPACLEVSAQTPEGVVMGLRHRDYPVEGIQFHPESIMTVVGKQLLANFMER